MGSQAVVGLIAARSRLILAHVATLSGWYRDEESRPLSRQDPSKHASETDDVIVIRKNTVKRNILSNDLPRFSRILDIPYGQDHPYLVFSLKGKIEIDNIVLIDHSRRAEAIVGTYEMNISDNQTWSERFGRSITIRGLLSIAPSAFRDPVLTTHNVAYMSVLPLCDGDVSDIKGTMFMDQAIIHGDSYPSPKATLQIWGANHNFFNTEWDRSDSKASDCPGQQAIFNDTTSESSVPQELGSRIGLAFVRGPVLRNTAGVVTFMNPPSRSCNTTSQPTAVTTYTFEAISVHPDVLKSASAVNAGAPLVAVMFSLTVVVNRDVTFKDFAVSPFANVTVPLPTAPGSSRETLISTPQLRS